MRGYGPETSVTIPSGDMGDTRNTGGHQGGAHTVEGHITHGPENAVHRRSPSQLAVGLGAVRALRHLPQDGLQVDRPLPAPRASRPGRALVAAGGTGRKRTSQLLAPNDVWSADYKGQFQVGDGRYCFR